MQEYRDIYFINKSVYDFDQSKNFAKYKDHTHKIQSSTTHEKAFWVWLSFV